MVHIQKKKKERNKKYDSFFITKDLPIVKPRNRFDHFHFLKSFIRKYFPQTLTNSISPYFLKVNFAISCKCKSIYASTGVNCYYCSVQPIQLKPLNVARKGCSYFFSKEARW